jgi:cytochrome bd-type quinol oxidase subunit 2
MQTTFRKEVVKVKQAIWNRVGPAAGLLFFPLMLVGLSIHRYPDIRPTDAQLGSWLASVSVNTFRLGVYVEAIGILLLIPFAAWLYVHLRRGARDASAPAAAMLVAMTAWITVTLPINESWAGLVGQARNVDIRTAQMVVSINQAWYDMTGIVLGVILLAAGLAIIRGGAMQQWVGWVAVIIGVVQVASAAFGTDASPLGLLAYVWIVAVGGYYTLRPARPRDVGVGASQPSTSTALGAAR